VRLWLWWIAGIAVGTLVGLFITTVNLSHEISQADSRIAAVTRHLRATQVHLAQVAVTDRQADISHLGLCYQWTYDSETGDVASVLVATPQSVDGVPSCPSGSFVSIVPGR
jgi:hypothetical protein